MKRAHKYLLGGLLGVAAIAAGLAVLLASDWPEHFIAERISSTTGREVHIGNLDIRLGRCVYIDAEDVRVTNPDWAKTPMLIDSRKLNGCAAWLPLFIGRLDFKEVHVESTRLGLEREGERVTWKMDEKDDDGPSRFSARHISVVDGSVYFRDAEEKTELEIKVAGESEEIRLQASGRFRNAPLQIVAAAPAQMPSAESPTLVSAAATLGNTTASAVGYFKEFGFEGMDVQLNLAGDDLSDINKLGINLPGTPPYTLRGRLAHADNTWDFSPFDGRIGDSDIGGELAYIKRDPRPLLRADIRAKLLDFDDLGPLIGAPPKTKGGETASAKQKAQAQQVAATDRVLPTKSLGMEKWVRMDADVRFSADRIQRPDAIPINGLSTHLSIENSTLRLRPLNFEMAGGKIKSDIVIEAKENPPRAVANFEIDNLEMARMFPKLDQQRAAAGKIFGRAKFDGRGKSIAELAGSSNGEITLMVNGGHMSALLLELAGLDAGEALAILFSRGDKPVPLRCAIADFDLRNGEGTSEIAVVDTVDTIFLVEGKVDLKLESLDLKVTPQPKDHSILVVRTPLLVKGNFNDPSVKPEIGPIAMRGGAAVLLGLVNPLLALLPLIETGPGKDSDCAAFAQLAKSEGVKTAANADKKSR